ncbi:MAG: pyridoxal phosphate-dependent aminotransferase family protein [Candidatus Obscuribacterales bacterium]|nr:pyridoxal phosphate-dependent aminotransferase family protein [Candidatus Obscuribacterales bacterium]
MEERSTASQVRESVEDIFVGNNFSERRRLMAEIFRDSPMFDVELKRVRERRLEDKNGHWLADFATQDYLGFDFEPEVIEAAVQGTRDFGTVVAWCRMVATVDLFNKCEEEIAKLLGSESVSIFASTTLLNHGVIPALVGNDGIIFLDKSAHATMYEAAKMARDSGAKLVSFPSNDLEVLEKLLEEHKDIPKKLITVDGVNSMTGAYTNLPALDKLAKKYRALIFCDDAHGFGVVGEKPDRENPYGHKGNGLVKYFGLGYENILYVGCFSKSYGSFGAFVSCSKKLREFLLSQATPHDLGGMGPASAMSAVLAGLKINEREGDERRKKAYRLTQKAIKGFEAMGFRSHNSTGFPIVSVRLSAGELMVEASKIIYDNHILLTLAPYPSVKRGDEAFRITFTATNTDEEVDQLLLAFSKVKDFLLANGAEL